MFTSTKPTKAAPKPASAKASSSKPTPTPTPSSSSSSSSPAPSTTFSSKPEQMVAVTPRNDCPHVASSVQITPAILEKVLKRATCSKCSHNEENWACLSCESFNCGRFTNEKHALKHYEETKHNVALGFADLSVWCYACDSYIVSDILRPLLVKATEVKFQEPNGSTPSKTTPSPSPATPTPTTTTASTLSGTDDPELMKLAKNEVVQGWLNEEAKAYGFHPKCLTAYSQTKKSVIVAGKIPYEHASASVLLRSEIPVKFPQFSILWQVKWESFQEFKARGRPATTHGGVSDMAEMELIEHQDNQYTFNKKNCFYGQGDQ